MSVRVKVKTLGILYRVTGSIEHEMEIPEGSTIRDVIVRLVERFPELRDEIFEDGQTFSQDYRIMLNGREVSYLDRKEETKVKNGDEIVVIPPVGGG